MPNITCPTCASPYDLSGYATDYTFQCSCGEQLSHPGDAGADFFSTGGGVAPTGPNAQVSGSPGNRLAPGTVLRSRYKVVRILGEGGMGVVYLIEDQLLEQTKAMKLLHPDLDAGWRTQLVDELRMQQQLSHESILRSYELDVDPDSGRYFFTMEYVEGPSLEMKLEAAKQRQQLPPLALEEISDILGHLTDALQYAHSKGIIHRDLKPSNILLPTSGGIKILDFGIARQIEEGAQHTGLVGTAIYMAPEQMRGGSALSPAADVYSLGVILYQMMTGELFYGRMPGPAELMSTYDLPGIYPKAIDHVVLKSLEALPNRRYATVEEFHDDFIEVLDVQSSRRPSRGRSDRGSRRPRQRGASKKKASGPRPPSPGPSSPPTPKRDEFWKHAPADKPSPAAWQPESARQAVAHAPHSAATVEAQLKRGSIWKATGMAFLASIALGITLQIAWKEILSKPIGLIARGFGTTLGVFLWWSVLAVLTGIGGGLLARWMKPKLLEKLKPPSTYSFIVGWLGAMIGFVAYPADEGAALGMAVIAGCIAPYYERRPNKKNRSIPVLWAIFGACIGLFMAIIEPKAQRYWFYCILFPTIVGYLGSLMLHSTLQEPQLAPEAE